MKCPNCGHRVTSDVLDHPIGLAWTIVLIMGWVYCFCLALAMALTGFVQ